MMVRLLNTVSVDESQLSLDDVIENFAEHLERYDIAPRDAENVWLTITQDVHDRHLPIKMKIERLHLLTDNFAFVVNFGTVGSIEIGADELAQTLNKTGQWNRKGSDR
jgi:hypothetical protein